MFESNIAHDVVVNVPLHTAYNQWTQFEDFPRFMTTVEQVFQMGDDRLHVRVKIVGHVVEYDAKIVEQVHDSFIAWESDDEVEAGGVIHFDALGEGKTRVSVSLHYAPQGAVERLGDLLGLVSMGVRSDLAHFKAFIEARGTETGAWRGDIHPQLADDFDRYLEAVAAESPEPAELPLVAEAVAAEPPLAAEAIAEPPRTAERAPVPEAEPGREMTSQEILDDEYATEELLEMRQLLLGPGQRWSLGHGIRGSVGVLDAGAPVAGRVHARIARRTAA